MVGPAGLVPAREERARQMLATAADSPSEWSYETGPLKGAILSGFSWSETRPARQPWHIGNDAQRMARVALVGTRNAIQPPESKTSQRNDSRPSS